jgi:AcrR family transcriptional regulator
MARHPEEERAETMSETRRLLLEAASREFAEKGFAGAKVDRISQAAGFAKGTIYNYFDSKRDLMLALIREFAQGHIAVLAEQVRMVESAESRMERFFDAGFAYVSQNLAQGIVVVHTLYGSDDAFKHALYAAYEPMFALMREEIIALGISQGIFRALEPSAITGLVMNLYLAAAWQVEANAISWITPAQVADFVLNGLRVRSS